MSEKPSILDMPQEHYSELMDRALELISRETTYGWYYPGAHGALGRDGTGRIALALSDFSNQKCWPYTLAQMDLVVEDALQHYKDERER
jgi:hypothetical protein